MNVHHVPIFEVMGKILRVLDYVFLTMFIPYSKFFIRLHSRRSIRWHQFHCIIGFFHYKNTVFFFIELFIETVSVANCFGRHVFFYSITWNTLCPKFSLLTTACANTPSFQMRTSLNIHYRVRRSYRRNKCFGKDLKEDAEIWRKLSCFGIEPENLSRCFDILLFLYIYTP